MYGNIDMERTAILLKELFDGSGYTVKDIQKILHLSCPQPIYRWFRGSILPSVDHLYVLSRLLKVRASLVFRWDTHLTKIKRRNVVFIVNASNRYTIAMTDIEPRNWNYYTMYISRVIHGVMQEMGYSEDQIGLYFKMSGDTTVAKTHGRKSVGGINRMVMNAQYFGEKLEKEAKYQWELSEYLNRDICQPEGFDAYGYPSELFKLDMERLGIAAKRKPAKVIDFAQYIENNRGTND